MALSHDGRASERMLLEACRSGDRAAAADLMRLHQELLARVVLRLVGRRSVTEEIVQETYLRAFQQIERFDPEKGARAWLLRVALNLARDYLRKNHSNELAAEFADDAPLLHASAPDDPERRATDRENWVRVLAALARLSPRHREILLLHYVEDLPFPEIASILRVPTAALKMRAQRARNRLTTLVFEGAK